MASLVLGAIGGFFFGPIGWMVGSLIGNLLSPGKGQDGPRLNSLKLMGSSYGKMIPITFGTTRVAGEVVWRDDLTEHKHSTGGKGGPRLAAPPSGFSRIRRAPASGGKGGPQVTTYTYTDSFAVKLCKGPKGGISRIWANGTIIYDTTASSVVDNSKVPITVYVGEETALADPTMEGILGVGNVPAFRDDCAVVFTDFELGDYGNTIPQLSFEVYSELGGIPWRVSSFTPYNVTNVAGGWGVGPQDGAFENGNLVISKYTSAPAAGQNITYEARTFDTNGVLLSTYGPISGPPMPSPPGGRTRVERVCINNPHVAWGRVDASGSSANAGWYYDGTIATSLGDYDAVDTRPVYWNNAIYACGGNLFPAVAKWNAPGGVPSSSFATASYGFSALAGDNYQAVVDTQTGDVWVFRGHQGSPTNDQVYHLDADLNLLESWSQAQVPADFTGSSLTVWNRIAFFESGNSSTGIAYYINAPGTPWVQATPGTIGTTNFGNVISLGNGLVLVPDGIISLVGQPAAVTLASIVSALSTDGALRGAGLSSGQINVTQLTDLVDGYIVSTQADCRTQIEPLRSGFFFDCVESSGVAKFVKRGAASVVSIPTNDLAAQQKSEQAPPVVEVKRAQEVDLPASVNVTYMNVDAAYQNGSQLAARQVTRSQAAASVELPIVMNDQKGRQVASVLLFGAWIERTNLTFRTSRKYDYLEPTDVVTLPGGYECRITRKMETVVGVLEFEALQTFGAIYVAGPAGNPTSGYSPPPVTPQIQPTTALLLDIPLVVDTDDPNGFYSAMAGTLNASWNGGVLYISRDAGANYSSLISDGVADTFGATNSALGAWNGGDVFDPISRVTVLVGAGGGSLANATMAAVINGANAAVIGNEIVQFMTATLTATRTYELSNFLRGRQGTEWAMNSHAIGDRFCLLPVNDVAAPFSDIAMPWLYKAVSSGDTLANTGSMPFTNTGTRLRCYAPVQLGGGRDGSGNLFLQWNRRTRIGGLWLNNIDALLSETIEAYHVYIYTDSTYATVVRTMYVLPANFWAAQPSIEYDAVLQTIDFGSPQSTVYWGVAQIGTLGDGTIAKAST